ncbi:MAG: nuclear transport factor 2 family protein [Gammaproteobacteria bacterium]
MSDYTALEQRIRRLEDRETIRELVSRYSIAIDDRDMHITGIAALFTPNGRFRTKDGAVNARGVDAVIEYFKSSLAILGPTNHFTHEHIIFLDTNLEGKAYGLVASHAELVRRGEPMLVALRYEDEYQFHEQSWKFYDRSLSYFYFMNVSDYAACLRETKRVRA